MRKLAAISFFLLLAAGAARPQGGERLLIEAGEAFTRETCREVADQCMQRIERYTRMKFRRPVPVAVQPKAVWEARLRQQGGFGKFAAEVGAAFYSIGANRIVVVPWVIGGYRRPGGPAKMSRDQWVNVLESTLIHELTHAIHHQNFYVVLGGARAASLRAEGQSDEEIDVSSVEFLAAEGTAELVSLRTCSEEARRRTRQPDRELDTVEQYVNRYRPNGKEPFRVTLSKTGYQDGINLMHHLTLKVGPRGVRAILYRPPPRVLFYQPDRLAEVRLDAPPEPDSILGFLSPALLKGGELHLTVHPGSGRFFLNARTGPGGPRTCLIGYAAEVGDADEPGGMGRYAFFVADPDNPGGWSKAQAASLKGLYPGGVSESSKPLPMSTTPEMKGVKVHLIRVKADDGSLYMRGEANGLVVMAHESNPTKNLEERVLLALRALYIKRPTPKLYDAAAARASR
jgi:hypothetical protein